MIKKINEKNLEKLKEGGNNKLQLPYDITIVYGSVPGEEEDTFMVFKLVDDNYKVVRALGFEEDLDYFIHYVNEYLLKGDNIFENMVTFLDNSKSSNDYMVMLRNEKYRMFMVSEYKNLLTLGFKGHKDTIKRLKSLK